MVLNFSEFLFENLAVKRNEVKIKCNDFNIKENVKKYWNQLHLLVEYFSNLFNVSENSYQKNKPIIGIDNWDTRNVIDMIYLFKNGLFSTSLNNWEVYNVQDFSFMFCISNFDSKIDNWEINKNADLSNMFKLSKIKKLPLWYLFKN